MPKVPEIRSNCKLKIMNYKFKKKSGVRSQNSEYLTTENTEKFKSIFKNSYCFFNFPPHLNPLPKGEQYI